MLIDEPRALVVDQIHAIIGGGIGSSRTEQGCYQIGHFGGSQFLGEAYEQYPEIELGCYGVCDSLEQVKERCKELSDPDREFVVTLTEVKRADQSPEGGWRWHKWGEYIGTHDIQCEYLYDEEGIDRVDCFHIYEKRKSA